MPCEAEKFEVGAGLLYDFERVTAQKTVAAVAHPVAELFGELCRRIGLVASRTGNIFFDIYGIYVKDSSEMIEEIKKLSLNIIERNISENYVEYNKIKNEIREELGKYLYHETECKPMIIAVVQEV